MVWSPWGKGRGLRRVFGYLPTGFALVTRAALGAVFTYAGIVKLSDPKAFARTISAYELVPEEFLPVVAVGLPVAEVIGGIGLVFNVTGSLTLISGMLLIFVIVLWYGILSGLDIDCGCFSTEELAGQASLWGAFYRDIVMLAGAAYLYLFRWIGARREQVTGPWARAKHII